MDNGVIFPYRRSCAHDEPGDANHPKLIGPDPSGRGRGVERGTRAGSSQAMGGRRKVAQPQRWLSVGKAVGRDLGKSGSCVSESRCGAIFGEVGDPMLSRKTSSEQRAARTPNRLR